MSSHISNPNILVERHYIPLDVYLQIYNQPSTMQSSPNNNGANLSTPMPIPIHTASYNSYTQPHAPITRTPAVSSTIRTTRRTMFSMPSNNATTAPTTAQGVATTTAQGVATTTAQGVASNNPSNTTHENLNNNNNNNNNNRNNIHIETGIISDENELNLFNAMFAALINPSRLDSDNNNIYRPGTNTRRQGLTPEQINDNSTIITYTNTTDNNNSNSISSNEIANDDRNGNNQSSNNICSICTLEYQPMEQIRSLDCCDHRFHTDCIDRWLADRNTCPLCRANVIPVSNNNPLSASNNNSSRYNASYIYLNGLD